MELVVITDKWLHALGSNELNRQAHTGMCDRSIDRNLRGKRTSRSTHTLAIVVKPAKSPQHSTHILSSRISHHPRHPVTPPPGL